MALGIRELALTAFLCAATLPSAAQDMNVRVLGWYPNQPQTEDVEKPFFKNLGQKTGLDLNVQYRSVGELNLQPFEGLRTLKSGAFDMMVIGSGWVSGDDPMFIGDDLPGLSFDFVEVQKVMDAWRPILEKRLADKYHAKLLAMAPYPPQVLFCKGDVKSLADLEAKKIRVASAAASKLVEAMGGTAVTLAGPEVYGALQRGVIDCGSTGTAYANANSWYEVSDVIYPIPMGGYSIVIYVARNAFWSALNESQQDELQKAFTKMEADLVLSTKEAHENGLRCNLGQQPCEGKLGSMKLVEPTSAEKQKFRQLMKKAVLPSWIVDCERVAPDCRKQWNKSVGKIVDITM